MKLRGMEYDKKSFLGVMPWVSNYLVGVRLYSIIGNKDLELWPQAQWQTLRRFL